MWDGGNFVTKSLGTGDRRIALELLRVEQGELQKKFDALRREHEGRSARLANMAETGFYDLSDSEIQRLASDWRAERSAAIEIRSYAALTVEEAKELCDEIDQDLARLLSPATEVLSQELGPVVRRLLIRSGLPHTKSLGAIKLQAKDAGVPDIPVGIETIRKLSAAVREVEISLIQAHRGQLRGTPSPVPLTMGTVSPARSYKLADLIHDYANHPGRGRHTAKTDLDYGMVFRAMRDVIGAEKLVSDVSREDCTKTRDVLRAIPRDATKKYPGVRLTDIKRKEGEAGLKTRTINSHISKMSSVFTWAVAEGHRASSPALNLQIAETVEEHEAEGRRSFTTEELRLLFSAPLYMGCQDDGRNFWKPGPNRPRRSRFWVPLIALFSGLRQTEICQLSSFDIDLIEKIDVIHVRRSDPSQKLKTSSAKRYVPVHPELIKLGFLAYAAEMRARGEKNLFPEIKADVRGYKGAIFQKRFNSFKQSVGINDPGTVFHSFRHTWRDALRNARISEEVAQVLGGWAGRGQDKKYGSQQFSASIRLEELSKIEYNGLDLSSLYLSRDTTPGLGS